MGELLCLRGGENSKQVIWLLSKIVIKEEGCKKYEGDKCKKNDYLGNGCFLNILFCFPITNLTGAVLRFSLIKQRIDLTSKANAKGRFKE